MSILTAVEQWSPVKAAESLCIARSISLTTDKSSCSLAAPIHSVKILQGILAALQLIEGYGAACRHRLQHGVRYDGK